MERTLFFFSHLKRYILNHLLVAPGSSGRGDRSMEMLRLSDSAISASAAPASARTAEAAPVCAAAWRVPRCARGSSWIEMLCSEVGGGDTRTFNCTC